MRIRYLFVLCCWIIVRYMIGYCGVFFGDVWSSMVLVLII